VIWFEIPTPLPIQENTPIKFKIDNVDYILKIEIIKNPSAVIQSPDGVVELVEDKFGLVNRSKIHLTIFKYIDLDERVELKTFSTKKLHFKILLDALDALNYFIERYRIITGNYGLKLYFIK